MRDKLGSLLLLPFVLLILACGDDGSPIRPDPDPDPDPDPQGHVFTYTRPAGAPAIQTISVRGTFNDWGEVAMALQQNGSWRAVVELPDGTHQYKYYINGAWPQDMCHDQTWGDPASDFWIDPDAEVCESDGLGGQNAVITIGASGGIGFLHAAEPVYVSAADGRLSLRFRAATGAVTTATVLANGVTYPMHLQLRHGSRETWRASVPENVATYRIRVTSAGGEEEFGPFTVPAPLFRAVEWVGDGVGYQIFPERFWNGSAANDEHGPPTDAWHFLHANFRGMAPTLTTDWSGPMLDHHCCSQYFGGDLAGVVERISHLESLGVTLIYLNPIFHGGSAHGYDTFDYLLVAPEFGGEPALRALVDAAHARGMKVMWDFVPNHTGVGHWAFQDALDKGQASAYWNWYFFRVPVEQVQVGNGAHYDGWWGIGSLPELNTANPQVMAHLLDVTRHWTEFGMDGIRVDVPESIRNPRQFFPAFRQAAKAVNPDVYLIGEVWGRNPAWLQGDEFDSLMNYALGLDVIRRWVAGAMTASAAAQEMALLYAEYPEASTAMQFNLASSHDTSRLLTLLGGGSLGNTPSAVALARQRLASAMLYTLPGVPVTFQGDECAFLGTQSNRDEHRYPFQWQSCNSAMLAHYQQLGTIRKNSAALRSAAVRLPTATDGVISMLRGEPGTGEVLAVFNAGTAGRTYTLPAGEWTDLASGAVVSGSLNLTGNGWAWLERR